METQVVTSEEKLDSASYKCESTIDQEDAFVSIPNGTLLGGAFSVRRKVESLKHGDIYDVDPISMADRDMQTIYQARVFQMEGLAPKLQAHINRTIRRMSGRTVLRITWGQLQVVVFKAEDLGRSEHKNHVQANSESPCHPLSPKSPPPKKPKKVSATRKESERLRQQSCRKAKQTESSPQDKAAQNEQEVGLNLLVDIDPDDIIFLQLINHITSFRPLWNSQHLKPYLEVRYKRAAPSDVKSLVDMMKHEMGYLRQQRNKFIPIMKKCTQYVLENWGVRNDDPKLLPPVLMSQELRLQKTLFIRRYMILLSGLGALDAILAWPDEPENFTRIRALSSKAK
ncbi:hypothetical protein F53441_13819 [Fusarium austroafricanum]|uniref:Uncharacterized protein n=1 Tax=Fusarium austroafricanum TaxID=2364996 RepID=A0A8H4NDW6_9HYPO|nr:hypothetical protein F53441_13819 [Fusarium austroafricanum]